MRLLVTLLAIFFIVSQPWIAMAEEPSGGVIDGQLTLKTGEGGKLADLDVILIFLTDEMARETRTTKTDVKGRFEFTELDTDKEYMVSVYYGGVNYYYPVVFGAGETMISIEMSVCDTTTSDERIRVTMAHIIMYIEEESISVTEVFLLVNDGDRTYVGSGGEVRGTIVFTLPEGASDFDAPPDLIEDYIFLNSNKVADTLPFPPGERQLVYSYRLVREPSSDFMLNLVMDYPTDRIEIMMQGTDIEVASAQLRPLEPVDSETGERFIHLGGQNLLRGDTVDISISSLSRGNGEVSPIVWFIAAVVILGTSIYLAMRKRTRTRIAAELGGKGESGAQE